MTSLESGSRNLRSPILMRRERDDVQRVGSFVSFRLEISSSGMQKLDHGFHNELVVLMPRDDETPLFFVVARLERSQHDDVDEVDSDDDESDSDAPRPPQEDYDDLCRSGATEASTPPSASSTRAATTPRAKSPRRRCRSGQQRRDPRAASVRAERVSAPLCRATGDAGGGRNGRRRVGGLGGRRPLSGLFLFRQDDHLGRPDRRARAALP